MVRPSLIFIRTCLTERNCTDFEFDLISIRSHAKNHIPGYFKFTPLLEELDEDVKEEQERMKETNPQGGSDILRVSQLQKKFRHLEAVRLIPVIKIENHFHPRRRLTFGVKPGECFGLLGINGAGKTTTFR